MTLRIAAAVAVFLLLPLIAFRGRLLRVWLMFEMVAVVFAWVVWKQLTGFDPYLAAIAGGVLNLGAFALVYASAGEDSVRWSPNRGALIALLVYSLVGPAMLRTPPDGDEPYYLLLTESIVHDFDFDLANQYRDLSRSETRRPDLEPQFGDPTGPNGERYSRHEPFLALLLIPGYLAAGLPGAIATMIVFAALLARSTLRMFEDEGIEASTARAVFPFFAFAPPVLYYAARIWPEVPAAFFFVEAIRAVRQQRPRRWIGALFGLSLLKLRFLLVAVPMTIRALSRSKKQIAIAAAAIAVPFLVVWLITGSATNVHTLEELMPSDPAAYARGLLGLLVDGASGIAFQAPFYLLGLFALFRWRSMPEAFRLGIISSLIYVIYLLPRPEWHGGWAPPLRYVVFLMPVLALGAAAVWQAVAAPIRWIIAVSSVALVIHGVTYPWRLFHIANGETLVSEFLSRLYTADFSRLFPSVIRWNEAASIAAVVMAVAALLALFWPRKLAIPELTPIVVPLVAVVIALAFHAALRPASVVHFEDAHVMHRGGRLYPPEYTMARYYYDAGWIVDAGDAVSFLAQRGTYRLFYSAPAAVTITVGGHAYALEGTNNKQRQTRVTIEETGRQQLRCLTGGLNVDRMEKIE